MFTEITIRVTLDHPDKGPLASAFLTTCFQFPDDWAWQVDLMQPNLDLQRKFEAALAASHLGTHMEDDSIQVQTYAQNFILQNEFIKVQKKCTASVRLNKELHETTISTTWKVDCVVPVYYMICVLIFHSLSTSEPLKSCTIYVDLGVK